MSRWFSRAFLAVFGLLSLIGGWVVLSIAGQLLGAPFFATSCERSVLASALSPSGNRAAAHVRLVCTEPTRISHTIAVGDAQTSSDAYTGYLFYEDDGRRQDGVGRIKPAVLWWENEDQLNVVYPPGTEFLDDIPIEGVTLRAASRENLE